MLGTFVSIWNILYGFLLDSWCRFTHSETLNVKALVILGALFVEGLLVFILSFPPPQVLVQFIAKPAAPGDFRTGSGLKEVLHRFTSVLANLGSVAKILRTLWASSRQVRMFVTITAAINALLFLDAIVNINRVDERLHGEKSTFSHRPEEFLRIQMFRNQRNAYIAGTSLFMMFVIYRLLSLQTLIEDLRVRVIQENPHAKVIDAPHPAMKRKEMLS
jgi:hypothetical protein